MIKASINVTKIEKAEIYVGKNGKYVGLVFFETGLTSLATMGL